MKIFIEDQMSSIQNGLDFISFITSRSIRGQQARIDRWTHRIRIHHDDRFDVWCFDCHLSLVSIKLVSFFLWLRNVFVVFASDYQAFASFIVTFQALSQKVLSRNSSFSYSSLGFGFKIFCVCFFFGSIAVVSLVSCYYTAWHCSYTYLHLTRRWLCYIAYS